VFSFGLQAAVFSSPFRMVFPNATFEALSSFDPVSKNVQFFFGGAIFFFSSYVLPLPFSVISKLPYEKSDIPSTDRFPPLFLHLGGFFPSPFPPHIRPCRRGSYFHPGVHGSPLPYIRHRNFPPHILGCFNPSPGTFARSTLVPWFRCFATRNKVPSLFTFLSRTFQFPAGHH